MSFIGDALGLKQPKAPDLPPPPPPLPPPTVEDTFAKAAQESDAMRKRQGRASTVLAGKSPDAGNVQTATKALLGS